MKEEVGAESSRTMGDDFICKESVVDLGGPQIEITFIGLDNSFMDSKVSTLYNSIGFGIIG